MIKKGKIIYVSFFIIISSFLVFNYAPSISNYLKWRVISNQAVEASAGLTYQIGLKNVIMIKCFTTGTPPICAGGTLCYTKDPATCTNYYDVSGTPAGGMGANALFSITATSMAGLSPGGQLIAGGTSPVLMDNGVLASTSGCSGCTAKAPSFLMKIKNSFDYIIAGIRGDEK